MPGPPLASRGPRGVVRRHSLPARDRRPRSMPDPTPALAAVAGPVTAIPPRSLPVSRRWMPDPTHWPQSRGQPPALPGGRESFAAARGQGRRSRGGRQRSRRLTPGLPQPRARRRRTLTQPLATLDSDFGHAPAELGGVVCGPGPARAAGRCSRHAGGR